MYLVLQEAVYRHFGEHTNSLLYKSSWDWIFLRQQRRLNLAIAADAVVQILVVVEDEEDLSERLQVAAVWQCFLADLWQELWSQVAIGILFDWRIDEFNLAPDKMMKSNQKYVFDLSNLFSLEFFKLCHCLFQISAVKVLGWTLCSHLFWHFLFLDAHWRGLLDVLDLWLLFRFALLLHRIRVGRIILQNYYQPLKIILTGLIVEILHRVFICFGIIFGSFVCLRSKLLQLIKTTEQIRIIHDVWGL